MRPPSSSADPLTQVFGGLQRLPAFSAGGGALRFARRARGSAPDQLAVMPLWSTRRDGARHALALSRHSWPRRPSGEVEAATAARARLARDGQVGPMPYPAIDPMADAGPAGHPQHWKSSYIRALATTRRATLMVERFRRAPLADDRHRLEHYWRRHPRRRLGDRVLPPRGVGTSSASMWTDPAGDGREHRLDPGDVRGDGRTAAKQLLNYLDDDEREDAVLAFVRAELRAPPRLKRTYDPDTVAPPQPERPAGGGWARSATPRAVRSCSSLSELRDWPRCRLIWRPFCAHRRRCSGDAKPSGGRPLWARSVL